MCLSCTLHFYANVYTCLQVSLMILVMMGNFFKTDWNWCKTSTDLCRLVYGSILSEIISVRWGEVLFISSHFSNPEEGTQLDGWTSGKLVHGGAAGRRRAASLPGGTCGWAVARKSSEPVLGAGTQAAGLERVTARQAARSARFMCVVRTLRACTAHRRRESSAESLI
jgi:hypothetical protein